jgi:RNA polymerase sigma-70 factor, ECF subfamily
MDDEALLERARRGDRDAFAGIVTRHQDELYTMALRITGTPADAADVVQETFLRAYVRIPELRGQTIRAWLFRVAINCSHDVQRRTVRRPADPLEDDQGNIVELPDPALGPEATALSRERLTAVREALLTLHPDFRAVVVLSYEEMSAALRVPVGTVKSRLNRGRTMLAKALRGSAAFPGFAEENA